MNQSFADRLSRLDQNPVDMIGAGNRKDLPPLPPVHTAPPKSFGARYNAAVIRNLVIGFIWMFATLMCIFNYGTFSTYLDGTTLSSGDKDVVKTTAFFALGLSLFVFFAPMAFKTWSFFDDPSSARISIFPLSVTVGGLLGLVAAFGPKAVVAFILVL